MLSAARAHNLSNLMGDPILSSGLRRTAGMRATGSNTPAGPAAERAARLYPARAFIWRGSSRRIRAGLRLRKAFA
jgi:hypothetical protein